MWLILLLSLGTLCVVKDVSGATTDQYGNTIHDNKTITWADVPAGVAYKTNVSYSEDGLELLFAFTRSFVNTVQPNDIPFDLIKKVLNGKFNIGNEYMQLVNYAMGFAVCFAIGLIYMVFLPLCGCCFCCCRCCGNCGGNKKQVYSENEGCKRMGFSQTLFLLSICLLASAACTYVTNDRFTKALHFADNNIGDNLDDLNSFINNTASEFSYIATGMYSLISDAIISDIAGLGQIISDAIMSNLNITSVINAVIELDTTVTAISTSLTQVRTDITALQSAASTLQYSISTLKNDIDSTKTTCAANCVPSTACDSFDTSVLAMNADFSTLPNLTSVQSNVDAVVAQNLTAVALSANSALSGISSTVDASTSSVRTSLNTTLGSLKDQLSGMTTNLLNQLSNSFDTTSLKASITDFFSMAKDYDVYRTYFGYGLTSLFSILPIMFFVGILCGCLCLKADTRPTERGCFPNCGGCLMLLAVAIMFLLGALLMLLTTMTFMIGGNMEKICQTFIDLTIFKDFLDSGVVAEFNLGEMLLNDATANISVYSLLIGCRANKAPFDLLQMNKIVPLDDYLNYTKYLGDIDSQLNTMSSSVNLSTFKVLTPSMESGLDDFKNSGIDGINFTSINATLAQNTVSVDFNSLIAAMNSIKNLCTGSTATAWGTHISAMEDIRNNKTTAVETAKTTLQASLATFESHIGGVTTKIDNVKTTAATADSQIQTNVTDVLSSAGTDFKNQILGYVDSYFTRVRYLVSNELAKCLPLWNLYNSFTTIMCSYTVDALNGFWFGLGWGLLFFIPTIVIAVKTSNYYRKMNEDEGYDDECDSEDEDPADFQVRYNATKRFNKVWPDYRE